jgi:hypothetical protein
MSISVISVLQSPGVVCRVPSRNHVLTEGPLRASTGCGDTDCICSHVAILSSFFVFWSNDIGNGLLRDVVHKITVEILSNLITCPKK